MRDSSAGYANGPDARRQSAAEWLQNGGGSGYRPVLKARRVSVLPKRTAPLLSAIGAISRMTRTKRAGGSGCGGDPGKRQIKTSRDPYLPCGAHLQTVNWRR